MLLTHKPGAESGPQQGIKEEGGIFLGLFADGVLSLYNNKLVAKLLYTLRDQNLQ